jgi:hypothetical protein
MSPSEQKIPDKGTVKDASREGRLSFRNFAEHQLRNEFKEEAIKKCSLQVKAFAECGKQEGLMVIFRCRDFQKEVADCMAVYNSPEYFEQYKQKHAPDLQKN